MTASPVFDPTARTRWVDERVLRIECVLSVWLCGFFDVYIMVLSHNSMKDPSRCAQMACEFARVGCSCR